MKSAREVNQRQTEFQAASLFNGSQPRAKWLPCDLQKHKGHRYVRIPIHFFSFQMEENPLHLYKTPFLLFVLTPRHVGSWFPNQGLNLCPCIDRRILNHWTPREVPTRYPSHFCVSRYTLISFKRAIVQRTQGNVSNRMCYSSYTILTPLKNHKRK